MRLVYFPVNVAWAFIFGDDLRTSSVITLEGFPRFFAKRSEAVFAAEARKLSVAKDGTVSAVGA